MPPRKTSTPSSSEQKKSTKLISPPPPPPQMILIGPPSNHQPVPVHQNKSSSLGPTPVPIPTTRDPLLALAGVADDELSDLMYEEVRDMIIQKSKGKSIAEQAVFMKQLLDGTDFQKSTERRMEKQFPVLENILNGKLSLTKKRVDVEMEVIED